MEKAMNNRDERLVGTIATLHRFPVKSMLGETRGILAMAAHGMAWFKFGSHVKAG